MEVIGAGFPRTGTLSTRSALHQLGFEPCIHGDTFTKDFLLCQKIMAFYRGDHEPFVWDVICRDYFFTAFRNNKLVQKAMTSFSK